MLRPAFEKSINAAKMNGARSALIIFIDVRLDVRELSHVIFSGDD